MGVVKIIIAGAGGRGSGYSEYAGIHPDQAKIVGVAEPRDYYRDRMAREHGIAEENVYRDWRDMAESEVFADAVIIATQDTMHREPAIAFLRKGYHVLLEKPMGPDQESCRAIAAEAESAKGIFAVCHVMRYTEYTRQLKALVESGVIGDLVSVQHLEPVGYWHQAHSFVRGKWRNETESSPMLLSKSCHDLDWIRHIIGRRCTKISSFGNLFHFKGSQKPAGAAQRCVECDIEKECPYSAKKIYLGRIAKGHTGWPVDVLTQDVTTDGVQEALAQGPYGRCVYASDNDVVDHQVVNMLFEGGATAAFTMTAFNEAGHRKTRIFGTRGELYGDGAKIDLFDFLSDEHKIIDTASTDGSIAGGHGGGDYGLMQSFVSAVSSGDASHILSGPGQALETHLMVFAAEEARKHNSVEDVG